MRGRLLHPKRSRLWWLTRAIVSVVMVGACLTELDPSAIVSELVKVSSTDGQVVTGRSRVTLRVVARSAQDSGVTRIAVRWSIDSEPGEGGTIGDTVTVTDGTGIAQVQVTLGSAEGITTVRAALVDDANTAVTFTITATGAPTLETVTPASFRGGDQVVVTGTNLNAATAFRVGGVDVEVLAVSDLGLAVTLVIPLCLPPGSVAFRAVAGVATSDPIFGDYTAAAGVIALQAGEFLSVSPSALQGCSTFAGAGPTGAEYVIAPQSATRNPGDTVLYRLVGSRASATIPRISQFAGRSSSYAQLFHRYLREMEREIAQLPPPGLPTAAPSATGVGIVKVGQRRNFEVCGGLRCRLEDYRTVRAEVEFVGEHAVIYQDVDAPENGLTPETFAALGAVFDNDLYDVATTAFGAESDVDNDDRIAILMTPVVNGLTPKETCETSFIAGFFFAVDISPGAIGDPRSNQAEVFFSIVPDPGGEVTCEFSAERILRNVPLTFIHEFQHMISFHQHAMLRGGFVEELWLNEAMSHLAEELGALHFRDLGDDTRFSRFASPNLINAYDYMLDPGANFVLPPDTGTGTLEQRGAGWLFLRWLVDQFGDDLTRLLSESELSGADNVERATAEPLSQLLPQWFLALWVSDLPDSILADTLKPARLRYKTWQLRTTFASLNEQSEERFPLVFPLVPDLLPLPSFGRQGVLRAGSGDFYRVVQPANDPGFTVAFTDPSGGALSGAVPRLNVVRIR